MTYSLTERKRIRRSFAKRATVLNVPSDCHAARVTAFQAGSIPRATRTGLQAAFTSIFPIETTRKMRGSNS